MGTEKKKVGLEAPATSGPGLREFYWEDGYLVFTREYHLKRGFCCQSGCRHCPWGFRKTAPAPEREASS